MVKLKALVSISLDGSYCRLTNYTKFIQKDENENQVYENVKRKEFDSSKSALESSLDEIITRFCRSVEERFGDLTVYIPPFGVNPLHQYRAFR